MPAELRSVPVLRPECGSCAVSLSAGQTLMRRRETAAAGLGPRPGRSWWRGARNALLAAARHPATPPRPLHII